MKEDVLALAEEIDGVSIKDDCDACLASGTELCRGDVECAESAHKACAKRLREIVERDACEDTTVSAYDLLQEEDRKALAWVREHGGLDMAASRFESGEIAADMLWGKGHGRFWTTDEFEEEISKRLMPEGMEWPKYTDGSYVEIGDEVVGPDYGERINIDAVKFRANGFILYDKNGFDKWYEDDDVFKRPPVLASDGEPLEVGQTVWNVNNGMEFTVSRLPKPGEYQAVEVRYRNGSSTSFDPDQLTHQRPEPPDSWDRIEEDATRMPGEYCERYEIYGDSFPQAEVMACDLVRRCRALAERGE